MKCNLIKKIGTAGLLLLGMSVIGFGQEGAMDFSDADQDEWKQLPKLTMPAEYSLKSLPYSKDNSRNQYFPEIFSQIGWSCNQASSIGYTFTYEINALRGIPSDREENLYDAQTVWNLLNYGRGDTGVSYFDSWEVIRSNGIANMADFRPYYNSVTEWMSGYDKYYNGMKNRVDQLYTIDVGTPEGLMTLKHWLNDHMDGSPYGGVANFQIGSHPMEIMEIPLDLEEGGQHIVTRFSPFVGHAMTFVGWNDEVKYDFNHDGQYTNDQDITGDGIVDMRDWEIGALLVVNSWGQWQDRGKAWVMYRLLAESVQNGGIWDNSVLVFRPKENYEPLLTMKVGMRYDRRDRIKIQAGVSNNFQATSPDHVIDFPCFSYQGGDMPMRGTGDEGDEVIEIGLDITPLMDFIEGDLPVKIFLEIIEDGSDNSGEGRIDYMSVYDHQAGDQEYVSSEAPMGIQTRSTTHVGVAFNPAAEPLQIVTEELDEARPGTPFLSAIQVTGGTPPYKWSPPHTMYTQEVEATALNFNGGEDLMLDTLTPYKVVDLPFSFPFYGQNYNQVTVMNMGGIVMGDQPVEYPYVIDPRLVVYQNVGVFPVFTNLYYVFSIDKVTVEVVENTFIVRWKAVLTEEGSYQIQFAAHLFPDGTIDLHYNYASFPKSVFWISALSAGDMVHYHRVSDNTTGFMDGKRVRLKPCVWPEGLTLTESGVLYGQVDQPDGEWILPLQVSDWNGLKTRKDLVFRTESAGVDITSYEDRPIRVYPNPFADKVQLSLPSYESGKMTIAWYDERGRLLDETFIEPAPGTTVIEVQPPESRGLLFYRIDYGTQRYSGQLVRKH